MRHEVKPTGTRLLPSTDPRRSTPGIPSAPISIYTGEGTGHLIQTLGTRVGLWHERWRRWRDGFEQRIGPGVRRYWALWRNFDDTVLPGPNQEWRDRTVIPESFKIIETRLPRLVLALFGGVEPFSVRGRGFRDEDYEDMVRELIKEALDEIGRGDPNSETFIKRIIDGFRYQQIMGHVFWKVWWKTQREWLRTKLPTQFDTSGLPKEWQDIDALETIYDNVDITWLDLGSVALDLSGYRRWTIERLQTSLEGLYEENEKYKKENGRDLYQNLEQIEYGQEGGASSVTLLRESYEEPRSTERWPLSDAHIARDPAERPVELWLCWDNVHRTLTKIANRRVELDHGLAPTPDGKDPYISSPAVPIPGRVYGESMLNWTGPLSRYQTRIARARADEVLLGIWQQYIYREGTLRSTQWFWRPGGAMGVEQANEDRPITDSIAILPRRPVFQEAYTEENYRQQQAESTGAADAISQGVEATQKSRDVTATEISQRLQQSGSRFQLENFYHEATFKKPMLQKIFDLLRANLTQPKMVRILGDSEAYRPIDLRDLDRPIDIVIGGGLLEPSSQEKLSEIDRLIQLSQPGSAFAPFLNPETILIEMLKSTRTLSRNTRKFVKTQEEVQGAQPQAGPQAATLAPPGGGGQLRGLPPPAAATFPRAAPGFGGIGQAGAGPPTPIIAPTTEEIQ